MAGYSLEKVYEAWDDTEGVRLIVRPDSDGGSYVELGTPGNDAKSEDYFGKIRLVLPPKLARIIGEALVACAKDLDPNEAA